MALHFAMTDSVDPRLLNSRMTIASIRLEAGLENPAYRLQLNR